MKFRTRYGGWFSCGWLPPVLAIAAGFIVVFGLVFALFRFLEPDIPWGAALFAALAVAVQAGIMGAVIAIGPWTSRHEHDFYH